MTQPKTLKLSICIPTFNRADFLGETLESIISQATSDCEIVVSDNASTDHTERVVAQYADRFGGLGYVRHDSNNGVDRNYDRTVGLARGEYCWLFTDDDLMKPGAIATVLQALDREFSLIVVNVEHRNIDMSRILRRRWINLRSNRVYGREDMDGLFADLDETLWYVGNIIIRRAIWFSRERERYLGSLFMYVGVIYQERLPGEALVIADPLVCYRVGNTHAWGTASEALLAKWPSLVESLAVSPSAKRKVGSTQPWKNPRQLLRLRGSGMYSMKEYRRVQLRTRFLVGESPTEEPAAVESRNCRGRSRPRRIASMMSVGPAAERKEDGSHRGLGQGEIALAGLSVRKQATRG